MTWAATMRRWPTLAAAIVVVSTLSAAHAAELKAGAFKPARQAPELALRGTDGAEMKLSRYRGKVVALGFGYTTCPDVCPTTLAYLAQAREKLGGAGKDFQVIYVTVDPERDSLERLKSYLGGFDVSFIGATGTTEQLAAARKAYGITISRENVPGSSTAYWVHHSSFVYLIDRTGSIRALVPFGMKIEDIVHDVKILLGD
jgi:protein SCO1/2